MRIPSMINFSVKAITMRLFGIEDLCEQGDCQFNFLMPLLQHPIFSDTACREHNSWKSTLLPASLYGTGSSLLVSHCSNDTVTSGEWSALGMDKWLVKHQCLYIIIPTDVCPVSFCTGKSFPHLSVSALLQMGRGFLYFWWHYVVLLSEERSM